MTQYSAECESQWSCYDENSFEKVNQVVNKNYLDDCVGHQPCAGSQ
jgi:hypothetical protein